MASSRRPALRGSQTHWHLHECMHAPGLVRRASAMHINIMCLSAASCLPPLPAAAAGPGADCDGQHQPRHGEGIPVDCGAGQLVGAVADLLHPGCAWSCAHRGTLPGWHRRARPRRRPPRLLGLRRMPWRAAAIDAAVPGPHPLLSHPAPALLPSHSHTRRCPTPQLPCSSCRRGASLRCCAGRRSGRHGPTPPSCATWCLESWRCRRRPTRPNSRAACCGERRAVLCCAVLCRVVLCCAVLCCAVLCCAVLQPLLRQCAGSVCRRPAFCWIHLCTACNPCACTQAPPRTLLP